MLKAGDRVRVKTTTKTRDDQLTFGSGDYPQIGWTGILRELFAEHRYDYNNEWVIDWDPGCATDGGDLIREWMLEPYQRDWDE